MLEILNSRSSKSETQKKTSNSLLALQWSYWLNEIQSLSSDAIEWDYAADFVEQLLQITKTKLKERQEARAIVNSKIRSLIEEHKETLNYFGFTDCSNWAADSCPGSQIHRQRELLEDFELILKQYEKLQSPWPSLAAAKAARLTMDAMEPHIKRVYSDLANTLTPDSTVDGKPVKHPSLFIPKIEEPSKSSLAEQPAADPRLFTPRVKDTCEPPVDQPSIKPPNLFTKITQESSQPPAQLVKVTSLKSKDVTNKAPLNVISITQQIVLSDMTGPKGLTVISKPLETHVVRKPMLKAEKPSNDVPNQIQKIIEVLNTQQFTAQQLEIAKKAVVNYELEAIQLPNLQQKPVSKPIKAKLRYHLTKVNLILFVDKLEAIQLPNLQQKPVSKPVKAKLRYHLTKVNLIPFVEESEEFNSLKEIEGLEKLIATAQTPIIIPNPQASIAGMVVEENLNYCVAKETPILLPIHPVAQLSTNQQSQPLVTKSVLLSADSVNNKQVLKAQEIIPQQIAKVNAILGQAPSKPTQTSAEFAPKLNTVPQLDEAIRPKQTSTVKIPLPKELALALENNNSFKVWHDFVCSLIVYDDVPGAFWVTISLQKIFNLQPIPIWLLKALEGARLICSKSDELVNELREISNNIPDKSIKQAFFSLAAAIRPALIAPDSQMGKWINSVRWIKAIKGLRALAKLFTAIEEFLLLGVALKREVLLDIVEMQQCENNLVQFNEKFSVWLDNSSNNIKNEFAFLLSVKTEDRYKVAVKTKTILSQWDVVSKRIETSSNINNANKAEREKVAKNLQEICKLGLHWCDLVERQYELQNRRNETTVATETLQNAVNNLLPMVETELSTLKEFTEDISVVTAITVLLRSLIQLKETLNPPILTKDRKKDEQEKKSKEIYNPDSIDDALSRRLTWLREIKLDENGQPTSESVGQIAGAIKGFSARNRRQ